MSNNIPDETSENFCNWIWSQFAYEPHEKLSYKVLSYFGFWSKCFVIQELRSWERLNLVILPKDIDVNIKDNDDISFLGKIDPTSKQIIWFPWALRYLEKLEVSPSDFRPKLPGFRIGRIADGAPTRASEGIDYYPDAPAPVFLWSLSDNVEKGTLVTASDALRFTPMFKRTNAEWFLPLLERIARKEIVSSAEIASKYRELFQKELQRRTP